MTEPFSTPLDAFVDVGHFMERWPDVFVWPMVGWGEASVGVLRVDEFSEDGVLVVRADLPGMEPDSDLELAASRGVLHIAVELHEEEPPEDRRYLRHELVHRHRLQRDLALPEGAMPRDLTATYENGVLEIRMPLPAGTMSLPPTRVPVAKG